MFFKNLFPWFRRTAKWSSQSSFWRNWSNCFEKVLRVNFSNSLGYSLKNYNFCSCFACRRFCAGRCTKGADQRSFHKALWRSYFEKVRSSHRRCSAKKVILKMSKISQENVFKCFPMKFAKLLRHLFWGTFANDCSWKILLTNFNSTLGNSIKDCISFSCFASRRLCVGAQRKKLNIAPFVKHFKSNYFVKVWPIWTVLSTVFVRITFW